MKTIFYWLMRLDPSRGTITHLGWHLPYAANPIPLWVVILIALIGLAAACINLFPQNIMPLRTRIGLLLMRLLGFAILLVLISQLEVRVDVSRDVLPRFAVLTDTSGSMREPDVDVEKDAGTGNQKGKSRLQAARDFAMTHLYAIDSAKHAGKTPPSDGKMTDISWLDFSWQLHTADRIAAASQASTASALTPTSQPSTAYDPAVPSGMTRLIGSIQEAVHRERDLQGIIVLTDGNDTVGDRGALLATMLASRNLPVFPIVFGKSAEPTRPTVKISPTTPYVRLGDEFRLNMTLNSTSDAGDAVVGVDVFDHRVTDPANPGPPIASRKNVRLVKGQPVNLSFAIKPLSVGLKTYSVLMEGAGGAAGSINRIPEQTVEVINNRVKVLYLDIPRDERKILGQWLARDPIVDLAELTLLPKGGWYAQGAMLHSNAGDGLPNKEEDLYKYDIIILGDIPRAYFRAGGDIAETKMQRLVEFVTRRGGGLITLGGRDVYAAGQYDDSALARILPFDISASKETQVPKPFKIAPTAAGYSHPLMMLESDPATNREAWLDLPPLDGNNFVGNVKPGASLLAVRTLEGGGTMPIIAVQPVGKGQVLSLSADTTWRWEFMRPEDGEDYYRRFWGNAIRTLAPDPRLAPNRPQITRYETSTPVGTTITMATRLVDPVYQPLRNADLDVTVTSPTGKITHIYPHDGRESPGLYEYQLTLDEPGAWTISARYKDQISEEHILAGESNEELDDTRAKPEAMAAFAKATGGESFTPDQAEALINRLNRTPKTAVQSTTVALWDLPAVMAMFIAILCFDCLIRKRRGMV